MRFEMRVYFMQQQQMEYEFNTTTFLICAFSVEWTISVTWLGVTENIAFFIMALLSIALVQIDIFKSNIWFWRKFFIKDLFRQQHKPTSIPTKKKYEWSLSENVNRLIIITFFSSP